MGKRSTNSNPVRGTRKPATVAGFIVLNQNRPQNRPTIGQIVKENLKHYMAAQLPYKTAKLCATNPTDWYVFFYYQHPQTGKFQRFKERHGLNNQHRLQVLATQFRKTVEQVRLEMAAQMVKVIDEALKNGFNPFTQTEVKVTEEQTVLATIQKVVDDLCAVGTQNARETYRLMWSRFKKYLEHKGYTQWPVGVFSEEHAAEFQKYLQRDMKLAKKTVNATIAHLGKFWDELGKKVKSNPFRKIKPLKDRDFIGLESDSDDDVFEPLTSAELDAILKELKAQGKEGFIRFMAFVYYAWARPVEITRLKISNIDLAAGVIRFSKSDTKNKKGGMVQIVPQLRELIKEMELHKIPNFDWYLFSKGFKPGPTQLDASRGVGYNHWNPVCEKLGIHKKLYALKHSGNIEYLMQNKGSVDLKWQQMQNRHSSAAMTERYNRKLGAYLIDVGKVQFRKF